MKGKTGHNFIQEKNGDGSVWRSACIWENGKGMRLNQCHQRTKTCGMEGIDWYAQLAIFMPHTSGL